MTVAAMQDLAEGGFGLASFSSRGPTRDNRVKPDIGAPGVNIMAPRANSGNQYVSYSGTSMATPNEGSTLLPVCSSRHGVLLPFSLRTNMKNN